ncbi:MAG: hypothetical protein DRO11_10380 [Methanobacteriota archaeon]|nr:MAG: hypothetical protein DRO11_10380 [Euryarchaeota archaeon]
MEGDRRLILVVEDDPELGGLIKLLLEKTGEFRVTVTREGREAIKKLEKDPKPDLILLDVLMPDMDGWQTLSMIREKHRLTNIPVAIFTSLPPTQLLTRDNLDNIVDYIEKPVNLENLVKRVKEILEREKMLKTVKEQIRKTLGDWAAERCEELIQARNLHANLARAIETLIRTSQPEEKTFENLRPLLFKELSLVKAYNDDIKKILAMEVGSRKELERIISELDLLQKNRVAPLARSIATRLVVVDEYTRMNKIGEAINILDEALQLLRVQNAVETGSDLFMLRHHLEKLQAKKME